MILSSACCKLVVMAVGLPVMILKLSSGVDGEDCTLPMYWISCKVLRAAA